MKTNVNNLIKMLENKSNIARQKILEITTKKESSIEDALNELGREVKIVVIKLGND